MGNCLGCQCSCPWFDKKSKDPIEPKDMAGSSDIGIGGDSVNDKPTDARPPIPPLFPAENEDQIPPHLGPVKQLYANGYNLSIEPDGAVRGTEDFYSKWAVLEFISVAIAELRIKGVESQLYLAMDENGELFGTADADLEETIFIEQLSNSYFYYLSKKYADRNWYVGITKSGQPKNGNKTAMGQKATKFLPRQTQPSS